MSKYPKLSHYVSEIDQFMQNFDHTHPELSLSQQKEQAKYRGVYELRDHVVPVEIVIVNHLWDKF